MYYMSHDYDVRVAKLNTVIVVAWWYNEIHCAVVLVTCVFLVHACKNLHVHVICMHITWSCTVTTWLYACMSHDPHTCNVCPMSIRVTIRWRRAINEINSTNCTTFKTGMCLINSTGKKQQANRQMYNLCFQSNDSRINYIHHHSSSLCRNDREYYVVRDASICL